MPLKSHATSRERKPSSARSADAVPIQTKVANLQTPSSRFGFNLPSLRDALCQDFQAGSRHWAGAEVRVIGEGPWQTADFGRFLRRRQFSPTRSPRGSIRDLVVGMSGWSDDALSQQLQGKNTFTLRIYTQEIFVFGIILGRDPYDVLQQDVIEEVAECHPAIQFILKQGFSWPWKLERDRPVWTVKLMAPSAALAVIVGPGPLSRNEVVSRFWSYIKKHKLQDKINQRMINADEKLEGIFDKPQVSVFEVSGLVARHMK